MTSCERVDAQTAAKSFVDRQKVLAYCKGRDLPVAAMDYGYEILLMGLLGALVGCSPGSPIPCAPGSPAGRAQKTPHLIFLVVASVAIGLQSYMLKAVPFNESSIDAANLDLVDHLSYGFYLWTASLVVFAAYCFVKAKAADMRR
jgi:hypothetical protein